MTTQGDITKAHCNRCRGEKNHHVLFTHEEKWQEIYAEDEFGQHGVDGRENYEVLKCCGCDSICIRNKSWFSEHCDDQGRPVPTVTYYPPAMSRYMPKWLESPDGGIFVWHDHFVSRLLKQIYTALFSECYALAAMGIRALLEQTMIEKVSDQGSFTKNLDAFEKAGHIGANQRKTLEDTLELGHAAMHRNFDPSAEDIRIALEITEGILAAVYVHFGQASVLKKRIPPRK